MIFTNFTGALRLPELTQRFEGMGYTVADMWMLGCRPPEIQGGH